MKLPAYPRYKPSGVEWLGDVPGDWTVKPLKRAVNFVEGPGIMAADFVDDGIPLLRISCIGGRRATLEGCNYVSEQLATTRWSHFRLKPRDLLISGSASTGFCSEVDDTTAGAIPYTGIIIIRPLAGKADRDFIRWFFLADLFLDQAALAKTGSTIQHFGPTHLSKMLIALPPLHEQQAIAVFLDRETGRLDRLVGRKGELIERLKEKRTALISRTVTRGLPPAAARAVCLPEHPPLKPSGFDWLGDIPAHWQILPLKRVSQISYGVGGEIDRSLEEGLRTLSLPNIDFEGNLHLDDVPFAEVTEKDKRDVLLRKGDLLFNWRNGSSDHLGKTAYFDADREYSHVSFLLRIRFYPDKHCSKFFRYLLGGYRVTGFFKHSKAGVNNTFNLSELSALPVMLPPLREQTTIAAYLDAETAKLDALVAKVETAIERLQECRSALITAAVTGKIDVRKESHA